jgi:hypothetical protein
MRRFLNLKTVLTAGVVGTAAWFGGTAEAGGYHAPCVYKTVVSWKVVQEPCIDYVVKYHPCGTPYRVKVVTYKTVRIPVERLVKVCY